MIIPFRATYITAAISYPEKMEGMIQPVSLEKQPFEATVQICGNQYHLIFGEQENGWFLCIPDWKIGVELSHPTDRFWNQESLQHAGMLKQEAVCIAESLYTLAKYIS